MATNTRDMVLRVISIFLSISPVLGAMHVVSHLIPTET